ncbi:MAG TPA: ABC transporter ATP-binding protein [Noviherbaspirillum sp.]
MRTLDLSLSIGKRELISRLTWQVEPGQCWCVIGRNGAGKSTLLRTLVGLRQPDAGSVQIEDRALADWSLLELARQRAYLPQGRNDAFGYSAIDTVLAARAALQALDVAELAERDVRTLSGGERQRVAMAATIAQDTPLLLLDELTSALDLAHQVSVMALLSRLCRKDGKAIIMVGHDLNMAHSVATHALLLMQDGQWKAGQAAEVMQASLLSTCLGYPIEAVSHGSRTIFVPVEEQQHE